MAAYGNKAYMVETTWNLLGKNSINTCQIYDKLTSGT